ncbi:ABC transporter permease [Stackebrandtia soli]|uniref:ABC transporter permease n=1 Tax=Stackebrandtia soli TaxID=1892856 RepID=UPI0039E743F5
MKGIVAAVAFEWLKLRRSTVMWAATAVLAVAVPLLSAGLMAAARSDSDGQLAVKARTMVIGSGWSAHFAVAGQVLSVATLVVIGIVCCWIFGREFTDDTIGALSSLAVSRGQIATAKFIVLAVWAIVVSAVVVLATILLGLFAYDGWPASDEWMVLTKLAVGTLLTAALTTPLALVSSIGRGYLTGIAVLFAIIVTTQIVTIAGLGSWFPYAAPSLWLGLGGPQAADQITLIQLLSPLLLSAVAMTATISWWRWSSAYRR